MEQIINADPHGKIALQGYDPVAFHTAGEAVKGEYVTVFTKVGDEWKILADAGAPVWGRANMDRTTLMA